MQDRYVGDVGRFREVRTPEGDPEDRSVSVSPGTCIPTLDPPVTEGTLPTSNIGMSGGTLTLSCSTHYGS